MWLNVQGHDDVAERFRRLLASGRLASTYLFVGPEGIGKRLFARRLAECLLCQRCQDVLLDRCGECESCRLLAAGNHPDVETVARRDDRQELTLDLFIGDRDHRNQEGLCHRLALAPTLGTRRIAVIDDADYFNSESANALLKTLEEPPRRALILLIGTSANRQLPTIRSRCQIVRFRRLDHQVVSELLLHEGTARDLQHAAKLADLSEGSLSRARELADDEVLQFREQLFQRLAATRLDSVRTAKAVREFVERAGAEARARRARLRMALSFAADCYRSSLRSFADDSPAVAVCLRRLDRCLEGMLQLERNANQATLIECWLDDLAHA